MATAGKASSTILTNATKAPVKPISEVKVFSATMFAERAALSDKVTSWLQEKLLTHELVECIVTQSSDSAFHCLTLTFFLRLRS